MRLYQVVDNPFNRHWNKEIIGKVYVSSKAPSYTVLREYTPGKETKKDKNV